MYQPLSLCSKLKLPLTFVVLGWGLVETSQAQMVGFSAELDTVFLPSEIPGDPFAELEYYGMYSVYAHFTDSSDVLGAIYSDVDALGSPPMGIDAPCGCFNPAATAPVVDASNNPAFFGPFPTYAYDSFWTIGMALSTDPGQLPSHIGINLASDALCGGFNTTNGSLYITGTAGDWPTNAVAGSDLKVLVARVTTCGDFSFQACVQSYPGGVQDQTTNFCPDSALFVQHLFNNGECVNDADGDGVCDEFEVPGCTDELACNYDPEATQEDASCEYAIDPYDCDGNCLNDADGDGICDEFEIPGCTGMEACNYDPNATDDDSSCIFPGDACDDGFDLTEGDIIQDSCTCSGYSCYDETACNFSQEGIEDNNVCSYISQYDITGNASPYSQTLQVYTYTNTAGSSYQWTVVGGDILEGQGTNEISIVWNEGGPGSVCVTETNAEGCSGDEECFIVDVTLSSIEEHLGGTLDIFPVPAAYELNLVWTGPTLDNATITLRDAAGRLVTMKQVAQREVLDVADWSAGTYTLEFTVPERGTIKRRILIQ